MKKLIKIMAVLVSISLIIAGVVFYGTFISVGNLQIVNETIQSNRIPNELDNMKIAFISDLHYNNYMDKERFEKMIETINQAQPDVILFGGDLFDNPSLYPVTSEIKEELTALLKSLDAPYGKFAVMGEEDHNPTIKDDILNILYYGDFELLDNESVLLRKDNNASINLVGIDSLVKGSPDITKAMSSIDTSQYTIVLTHAPDIFSDLPNGSVNLVLSGHGHGGQLAVPIIGPIVREVGAQKYTHGTYYFNSTTLLVSNGLGTTDYDIRIFAPPQCHILRLTNK